MRGGGQDEKRPADEAEESIGLLPRVPCPTDRDQYCDLPPTIALVKTGTLKAYLVVVVTRDSIPRKHLADALRTFAVEGEISDIAARLGAVTAGDGANAPAGQWGARVTTIW